MVGCVAQAAVPHGAGVAAGMLEALHPQDSVATNRAVSKFLQEMERQQVRRTILWAVWARIFGGLGCVSRQNL